MEETEGLRRPFVQGVPVPPDGLKEGEGAHHVGGDELAGAVDGPVHVGLCSQVHHGVGAVFRQHGTQMLPVPDVAADKDVPGISFKIPQRLQVPRVGELVVIYDRNTFPAHKVPHEVAADETGSAGEKNS